MQCVESSGLGFRVSGLKVYGLRFGMYGELVRKGLGFMVHVLVR